MTGLSPTPRTRLSAGGPVDDRPDIDAGYWAGHLPLRIVASPVVPDPEAPGPVPEHVLRRAADFA